MRRHKRSIIFLLVAAFLAVGMYFLFFLPKPYSQDQSDIMQILGNPDQFVIFYLPRGEKELIRSEVWLYPTAGKRIGFSGGNLAYVEDYTPGASVSATTLVPWDFDYELGSTDLQEILGPEVEEGTFFPGMEETRIYYSPQALFVTDGDRLTYFQTLGVGDKSYLDAWEKQQEGQEESSPPPPGDWKKYTSSDMGFQIDYPTDWFLEYGVLSSYDTGYLEKNLPLPDKRLKCDFFPYDETTLGIRDTNGVTGGAVEIQKGKGVDLSGEDGPGLGDSVLYLMQDGSHPKMALLCYSYDESFTQKLEQALQTFSFISK